MSTVMMMDAESANHWEDGNSGPGEKKPSSSAHQMKIVLLWLWLTWLSPRWPGRCGTMDQLEFKCEAALGPALGAEPAVTSPFWVISLQADALSFPLVEQIVCKHSCHAQMGGFLAGMWKGGLALVELSPLAWPDGKGAAQGESSSGKLMKARSCQHPRYL